MPKFYEEFTDSCLKTDTKRSECRYSTIPFFKSATISKSIKLPNSRTEVPALNDGSLSTKKVRNPRGHHEYGEFSLNKRKRWTLANDFRKNIESWNELPNVSVEVIEVAHRLDNLGGSEGIRNSASRTTSYHSYANGRPIHRYPLKTFAKCETLQGREVKKQRKQQKTPSKNETVEKDHANEKGFKPPEIEVTYTIKTPFRSLSLYEKYRKSK